MRLFDDQQRPITLHAQIAEGGEGTIHTVNGQPNVLAKLHKKPRPEHKQKLDAMIQHPVSQGIAWPTNALTDEHGNHRGHLMPQINNAKPLATLYNPNNRRQQAPAFHYQYLVTTAHNLLTALQTLHDQRYVFGDLNDNNILVHQNATITLIDADTIQVPKPSGHGSYRCTVTSHIGFPRESQAISR